MKNIIMLVLYCDTKELLMQNQPRQESHVLNKNRAKYVSYLLKILSV